MAQLPDLTVLVFDAEYRVLTSCGAVARADLSPDKVLGHRLPELLSPE